MYRHVCMHVSTTIFFWYITTCTYEPSYIHIQHLHTSHTAVPYLTTWFVSTEAIEAPLGENLQCMTGQEWPLYTDWRVKQKAL